MTKRAIAGEEKPRHEAASNESDVYHILDAVAPDVFNNDEIDAALGPVDGVPRRERTAVGGEAPERVGL